MWKLTKHILGFNNEDLGVREAADIDELMDLLKEEFHEAELYYEKNMYSGSIYTIHFKAYSNLMIIAIQS